MQPQEQQPRQSQEQQQPPGQSQQQEQQQEHQPRQSQEQQQQPRQSQEQQQEQQQQPRQLKPKKIKFDKDVHEIIGLLSFSIYQSVQDYPREIVYQLLSIIARKKEEINYFSSIIYPKNEDYKYVLIASLLGDYGNETKGIKHYYNFNYMDYLGNNLWNKKYYNKRCDDFIYNLNKNTLDSNDSMYQIAHIALVIANIFDQKQIKFLSKLMLDEITDMKLEEEKKLIEKLLDTLKNEENKEITNMTLEDEIKLIKSLLDTLETQKSYDIYKYLDVLPGYMHPITRIINYLEEVKKYRKLHKCFFLSRKLLKRVI